MNNFIDFTLTLLHFHSEFAFKSSVPTLEALPLHLTGRLPSAGLPESLYVSPQWLK